MSLLDIDALLLPVDDAAPLGIDVEDEGDDAFSQLEVAVKDAKDGAADKAGAGDWAGVRDLALALLKRSKHLRVAVYLTGALTRINGYNGISAGLSLIARSLALEPNGCHPVGDAQWRVNMLAALNDDTDILGALRRAPLTESRKLGRFNYRDYEIAIGALTPLGDETTSITEALFMAALDDTDAEFSKQTAEALDSGLASIKAIEQNACFGVGHAPQLDAIKKQLFRCKKLFGSAEAEADAGVGESANSSLAQSAGNESAKSVRGADPGKINSLADCKRVLGVVQEYLKQTQPSHPAPLFIARAVRMLDMSFIELIKELNPDGLREIRHLGGIRDDD